MRAEPLGDELVVLEPLCVEHAEEMAAVLADGELYAFTGGEPPTPGRLRGRYEAQVRGRSADGGQWWLNWVVRCRADGAAAGYVQATVDHDGAELAWVIGLRHHGRGLARASAGLVVAWLREQGVGRVIAHVHPGHAASGAVARGIGLAPTQVVVDGEVRWESR
ncbi:GNAT family N-acetyltransferase [Actinokineospora fastidiosa]|uniref:Acetyltransferase n=1 Tax=Actinokineospora fastidiosa TaxID=1816 RepID=A0A918GDG9_9PSEU|nr:GNAT family N-acetyltransferase [Actinokineospora fastidiosa]GGS29814.1 acetyltransferase [Actinokineospora fastidiosa]